MEEFNLILSKLRTYRPAILNDPFGTLPILADDLEEHCGPLGQETALAIRYFCRTRIGLEPRSEEWESWLGRVMLKYGPPSYVTETANRPSAISRERLLVLWTEVEFLGMIQPGVIHQHPILTMIVTRMERNSIYLLADKCLQHVDTLILDFTDSPNVYTTGVVGAVEYLGIPRLRRLMIRAGDARTGNMLKGKVSVALMQAVQEKRIPRGVEFWWNGDRQ